MSMVPIRKVAIQTALACIVSCAMGSNVLAQNALQPAIDAYDNGELEQAREALDAARESSLDRDGVVQWLVYRALVAYASDDADEQDAALLQLATLGEEDPLGRRAPPPLRTRYEQAASRVQQPLDVAIESERTAAGVRVTARVSGDLGGLIEAVRLRARRPGGEWLDAEGNEVFVPTTEGTVEVAASAMGPGSSLLASRGTENEPHSVGQAPTEDVEGGGEEIVDPPPPAKKRTGLVVGLTLSILAVLAGGAVLTYFLVRGDDGQHEIGPPIVVF